MASAFSSVKQGLIEAVEFSKGKARNATIHEFVFYTAEPEVAKSKVEAIKARVKNHDFQYSLSEDTELSVYQSFRG